MARRLLPRFEVVGVRAGNRTHFLAYDHLAKLAVFPPNLLSYDQASGLVAHLAQEARRRGEPLALERDETPAVKPPAKSRAAQTARSTTDGREHRP